MAQRKKSVSQKDRNLQRKRFNKFVRWMWVLAGGVVLAGVLVFVIVSNQNLPSFDELENPDIDYASVAIADNGDEIGRFFVENRVAVPFDSLNPHLVDALISTEDIRYYNHSGIDFQALMRVLVKTIILQQGSAGGGSTITQQLAKQLYSSRDFAGMGSLRKYLTLVNYKLKEWVTAVRLEKSYTKEEIIAMYLNNYDFIYDSRGVQAASETYFGKDQSELEPEEAAVLVGMLKNSVLYNPKRFPEKSVDRRNTVLYQMEKANAITETEYDSLTNKKLDVSNFHRTNHISGDATYFRAELRQWVKNLIQENNIKKPDGSLYNVDRDGLRIHTTIDLQMQRILEKAARKHMAVNQERFFREWKGKDVWSYKYDNYPVEIKQQSLENMMRTSDRYYRMQSVILGDNIAEIQNRYDIFLKDYDLTRMVKTAEDPDYLTRLESQNLVSEEKADIYRKIIESDLWASFKSDYTQLQKKAEKVFNEKTEMRIFTYENEEMEKDTVMTPMDSIKYLRMILQIGSVAMNPANGHVKAWVGGVNHKYFQYDHVYANRQVGSTFKPFLYATAIALQGFSPCFPVMDIQYTINPGEADFELLKPWTPQNAMGEYDRESITLYEALRKSKNTVSTYLMKQMGSSQPLRGLVSNMGMDSSARLPNGRYVIPKQPSIALGATDLSPMEMTAAYSTFANNGTYNKPIFVKKIEDRNGKVLYEAIPKSQVALSEEVNYVMIDMLKYVAQGMGGFNGIKSEVGGKTGTTNDHTDGWFMGVTPDIVVGTWVGGEDRWMRFRRLTYGQGSMMARPVFQHFLRELEKHPETGYDPSKRFYRPKGDLGIILDCDEYRKFDESNNSDYFEESYFEDSNDSSESERGGFFEE